MDPKLNRLMAATVLAAISSAAVGHVVREISGNPGIQKGGHALDASFGPPVPYSLVGAIAQCVIWPWRWLGRPDRWVTGRMRHSDLPPRR